MATSRPAKLAQLRRLLEAALALADEQRELIVAIRIAEAIDLMNAHHHHTGQDLT